MKIGCYRGTWTDSRQPNKYRGKIEFNQNIDSWVSAYITFEGDYKRGVKCQYCGSISANNRVINKQYMHLFITEDRIIVSRGRLFLPDIPYTDLTFEIIYYPEDNQDCECPLGLCTIL